MRSFLRHRLGRLSLAAGVIGIAGAGFSTLGPAGAATTPHTADVSSSQQYRQGSILAGEPSTTTFDPTARPAPALRAACRA